MFCLAERLSCRGDKESDLGWFWKIDLVLLPGVKRKWTISAILTGCQPAWFLDPGCLYCLARRDLTFGVSSASDLPLKEESRFL
jgi:hypothetical protein